MKLNPIDSTDPTVSAPEAATLPTPPDSAVIAAVDGLVNSDRTSRAVHPVPMSLSPPTAEASSQHPAAAQQVLERYLDAAENSDNLTLHFKKFMSPTEVFEKLKDLKKEAAQLKIDTDKVHTDLIAKGKELHGDHLSPVHIPKEFIVEAEKKIYVEMGERWARLNREIKKCQKDLARHPAESIDDQLKTNIKHELSSIEEDLNHTEKSIRDQLSFHKGTKIAQMLEQLVRLMHEMNEVIRLVTSIY
jgi:hypothetical protein